MRVFITGGAGFIGSRLAEKLSSAHHVTVFDSLLPQVHEGNPENQARLKACGAELIIGDVRDAASLSDAIRTARPDLLYHLAAETGTGQSFDLPVRYSDVNVMGTAHLIEAIRDARTVKRVILAGSRSVYGEGAHHTAEGTLVVAPERSVTDMENANFECRLQTGDKLTPVPTNADCPVAPASIYASTKLMQEYMLGQAFWGTDVQVGILRLQNVFGPGQSLNNPYTGVLSIFSRQIQEGASLNIYEDGTITRDFVHVEDVAQAFAMMGQVETMPSDILDIGSGQATTILEIAQMLLALFDQPTDKFKITGQFRPGDIRYAVADISRAQDHLGWTPQVPLSEGLRQLAAWSRKEVSGETA